MKNIKPKKNKKIFIIVIPIVILIAVGITGYFLFFNNYYKVEDNVSKITNYKDSKKAIGDVDGWLKVQGTNIDYPVIYNNSDFDPSNQMEDFVWINYKNNKLTNRVLIFGHNILNVSKNPLITDENHSRFEQLMSFAYLDFVKENKYIQYTKNDKEYLYKIYSISFVEDSSIDYFSSSYSKSDLKSYIKTSKEESIFDFDIDINENDDIITLITCTRMFGGNVSMEFKVDARLIREKERVSNYKVEKNENYKEIEKIMKGGVNNEENEV